MGSSTTKVLLLMLVAPNALEVELAPTPTPSIRP